MINTLNPISAMQAGSTSQLRHNPPQIQTRPNPTMIYDCFGNGDTEKPFTFDVDTHWCHGIIFKYKGYKKETWLNVLRKTVGDLAPKIGSQDLLYHHYIWFPEQQCSVGLRKINNNPNEPPVLSTPDVYKSHQCFNPASADSTAHTKKEGCADCNCDGSSDCPGFDCEVKQLGSTRLAFLKALSHTEVEKSKGEQRLQLSKAIFDYCAHMVPEGYSKKGAGLNCNLFHSLWASSPDKLLEFLPDEDRSSSSVDPSDVDGNGHDHYHEERENVGGDDQGYGGDSEQSSGPQDQE